MLTRFHVPPSATPCGAALRRSRAAAHRSFSGARGFPHHQQTTASQRRRVEHAASNAHSHTMTACIVSFVGELYLLVLCLLLLCAACSVFRHPSGFYLLAQMMHTRKLLRTSFAQEKAAVAVAQHNDDACRYYSAPALVILYAEFRVFVCVCTCSVGRPLSGNRARARYVAPSSHWHSKMPMEAINWLQAEAYLRY